MTALPPPSDLVRRAMEADPQALTELYKYFAPRVYRYVYMRVGDVDLAQDIQSEVFVRMLESIHTYEDRGWSISSWIYRIAQARTIDIMRGKRRRQWIDLEEEQILADGPEEALLAELEHHVLRKAMKHLCEPQQRVILLRHVYGLSIEETARQMGRNVGSVKALQHRALTRLSLLMQVELGEHTT
ncbi:RNA polymerase sigma factor [Candidatus Viridilinea mediisalina]|uniref:RNA polymerase subunit sigma-24 n=1 Tax=Candidatus Viridilinea mediisalina TaxID=2024553 RepID=A0A2A6RDU5_9CHLR|nr:RNA polymerase sigma factor [Candidatus Viridilinea mediisalina]PDW00552.1 hypothetical protein CJ255_20525 [Candidatus Viridilinea mediisalina]